METPQQWLLSFFSLLTTAVAPFSFYLLPSFPLSFFCTSSSPPCLFSSLPFTVLTLLIFLSLHVVSSSAADELSCPPPGFIPLSLHAFITLSPQGFVLPNQELKCCLFTQTMPALQSGLFVNRCAPQVCQRARHTFHAAATVTSRSLQLQEAALHITHALTHKPAAAAGGGRAENVLKAAFAMLPHAACTKSGMSAHDFHFFCL